MTAEIISLSQYKVAKAKDPLLETLLEITRLQQLGIFEKMGLDDDTLLNLDKLTIRPKDKT